MRQTLILRGKVRFLTAVMVSVIFITPHIYVTLQPPPLKARDECHRGCPNQVMFMEHHKASVAVTNGTNTCAMVSYCVNRTRTTPEPRKVPQTPSYDTISCLQGYSDLLQFTCSRYHIHTTRCRQKLSILPTKTRMRVSRLIVGPLITRETKEGW